MDTQHLSDQLSEAVNMVLQDLKSKYKQLQHTESLMDMLRGFAAAINWEEPFVAGLVAFQAVLFLLVLFTRKHATLQAVIFGVAAVLVYFGERINELGGKHWEKFARQRYFDPRGVFYSTMVSGPLLLDMFIILINYLILCSSLLIRAKRMELRYKARQRQQQAADTKKEQ